MKKSKEETQKTRQTILRTAARAFRECGFGNVSVKELMAQAGLTHGGFYAHFPSKEALFAEICGEAFAESVGHLTRAAEAAPAGHGRAAWIEAYLSPAHRDQPGHGCMIPSLGAEVARESREVKQAFTLNLTPMLARIAEQMDDTEPQARQTRAMAQLAQMVGGLLLARAVDDPELSDRILEACRASLLPEEKPRG
jgi:TetR/AcrR family transcriptional repressor of nem operon